MYHFIIHFSLIYSAEKFKKFFPLFLMSRAQPMA